MWARVSQNKHMHRACLLHGIAVVRCKEISTNSEKSLKIMCNWFEHRIHSLSLSLVSIENPMIRCLCGSAMRAVATWPYHCIRRLSHRWWNNMENKTTTTTKIARQIQPTIWPTATYSCIQLTDRHEKCVNSLVPLYSLNENCVVLVSRIL